MKRSCGGNPVLGTSCYPEHWARCRLLWGMAVLEQWAAALRTPSMQRAPIECSGPHMLGTEFLRHMIEESIRVWYVHAKARDTLLKARLGPGSTMAWVLQELRLHQRAEREGIQRVLLG